MRKFIKHPPPLLVLTQNNYRTKYLTCNVQQQLIPIKNSSDQLL